MSGFLRRSFIIAEFTFLCLSVTVIVQQHSLKFTNSATKIVRLRGSGKLGELFNVQADGSTVRLAAVATFAMADAHGFLPVGLRGLETHHVFLYSP